MRYQNPDELKTSAAAIRAKLQHGRPLPLKGRCVPIFEKFMPSRRARILECGPGAGRFLRALADRGYTRLFGCDIGRYIVPEIEKKLSGFAALDLSFNKLPWPDNSFDAVCAWEVLEHLENPHNVLREIHRVLRPGGFFMISLPNIFHIVSRLVFLKRGVFPQYNEKNNHLSLFPRGVFEKTVLKYFDLQEEGYVFSGLNWLWLAHVKFLPENQWFGRWVYYVLKKKS